ncbi:MAG: PAS domain-containing sensor histidine kinase [Allosphingosinicella sp.]
MEASARKAHLRSVLETAHDAMVVIDESGLILSFDDAAVRMFGYSEDEVIGENVSLLMPSPERERHDLYIEAYLDTGIRKTPPEGQLTTARRRDGGTFPINLQVGVARLGDERVFTGFIRDLTEENRTELRLLKIQAELAHVSQAAAMGTLATTIAHELNQPLTAIANYVDTARKLLVNPDEATLELVRDALEKCSAQSVRAGQIIQSTRDFVSSGESRQQVESLSRMVSKASAIALVGAGERGLEMRVKLDPPGQTVFVDRIRLQQVIVNLIRNAIEAMSGSPVRRIGISSCRDHDGQIRITVEDSGPGLSPEIAKCLFEPFKTTKPGGRGLGLSICHAIVVGDSGRIWAGPSTFGGAAIHFTVADGSGTRQ